MRISRRRMASVVVMVLVSVSAGGAVAAQDDGAVADVNLREAASVSGVVTPRRPNQPREESPGEPPVVRSTLNYGWTLDVEMDDPRLSGTYETNQNESLYASGELTRTGRGILVNDGGSWSAEFRGFTPDDAPGIGNYYATFFSGEGAYAGLSAMLWMEPSGPWTWEAMGVIVPGSWPEPPGWVLPPDE